MSKVALHNGFDVANSKFVSPPFFPNIPPPIPLPSKTFCLALLRASGSIGSFLSKGFTPQLFKKIKISAKNITIDKNKKTSIFENEVSVLTSEGDVIKSDFAEYNKDNGILILKNNISLTDKYNNILTTNHIEYREKQKIFSTKGPTKIITSEKNFLEGRDLTANK